jgi:hypothetical protein
MSVYTRSADIVAARLNFSIISVSNLETLSPDPIPNLEGYWQAMDWLLDFDSAGIPAPSTIAAFFWNGKEQLSNGYWAPELANVFRSVLAYPLWMFNANNFGNIDLSVHDIVSNLPAGFYTTAVIADPLTMIQINRAVFAAFICCDGLVLVFVWSIVIWLCVTRPSLPCISSFPLMDIALKTSMGLKLSPTEPSNPFKQSTLKAKDGDILQYAHSMPRIRYVCETSIDSVPTIISDAQTAQVNSETTQDPLSLATPSMVAAPSDGTSNSASDHGSAETSPLIVAANSVPNSDTRSELERMRLVQRQTI